MTKHKEEPKPEQGAAPAPEAEAAATISGEELAALTAQLAEAGVKANEYLEALQRERADFTNYRRRVELERDQSGRWTTGETIKKFLPILDDLERALAHRPADSSWADGVDLVYRKFQVLLDKEGITTIDALGKPFDPTLHEAILQEPSSEHEPGTVIAVLQQGYMLGERVLRPAMVKVAQ